MHRKAVSALVLLSVTLATAAAADRGTLRGEITSDAPLRFQDLNVEIRTGSGAAERAIVSLDGRFEFRDIPLGQHRVRVTNMHGDVIREEIVNVQTSFESTTIRLRGRDYSQPPAGSVSVRRLMHKPNKQAVKELQQAAKLAGKGDHVEARTHLERSVALDPEYFEAQYSLGGERVMAGDAAGAVAAYDKALEIDPSSAPALVSRGMVLLHLHKVDEAEMSARKALQMGAEDPVPAHYVLGLSLAARGKNLEEALEHLKMSASRFAHAAKAVTALEGEIRARSFAQK